MPVQDVPIRMPLNYEGFRDWFPRFVRDALVPLDVRNALGDGVTVTSDGNSVATLTTSINQSAIDAAIAAHEAEPDPHSVYLTPTEGNAAYDPLGAAAAAVSGLGTASVLDVDTDGTLAADSDSLIATQRATKTYVDAKAGIIIAGAYGIYASSDLPKTADTTLAADTALDVTLDPGKKYKLYYDIFVDSAATPDWKYDFQFGGTVNSVLIRRTHGQHPTATLPAGNVTSAFAENLSSAFGNVQTFTIAGNDTTAMQVTILADVATGGVLSFRWAQATSSPTAVIRRRNSCVTVIAMN